MKAMVSKNIHIKIISNNYLLKCFYLDDDDASEEEIEEACLLDKDGNNICPLNVQDKQHAQKFLTDLSNKYSHLNNFDFFEVLFHCTIPLILSLMKTFLMNSHNLENIEDRVDLNTLLEYGECFSLFFKLNITNTEWKKLKMHEKMLNDFEKLFYVKFEYPPYDAGDDSAEMENKNDLLFQNEGLPFSNLFPPIRNEGIKFSKNDAWRVFLLNFLLDSQVNNYNLS